MPPRSRLLALLVALFLPACVTEPAPAVAGGGREDVWVHDGTRARRAILEADREGVLTVLWSDPPPRPNRDLEREQRWIFAGLEPPATLRLSDGKRVEHPDPAEVKALGEALDATGDVEAVLAGLPRLARLSSRGRLLARAAAIDSLYPAAFEALLAAVTTERAQHALGRGPGAIPAGGDPSDALAAPLARLAARAEIGPPEARALLEAARDLPRSEERLAVLQALLASPLAPVDPADALAAASPLDPEHRARALLAIASRLPLDPAQAAETLMLARTLPLSVWQADVYVALVGKAEERELLDAASDLRDAADRRRVLAAVESGD